MDFALRTLRSRAELRGRVEVAGTGDDGVVAFLAETLGKGEAKAAVSTLFPNQPVSLNYNRRRTEIK